MKKPTTFVLGSIVCLLLVGTMLSFASTPSTHPAAPEQSEPPQQFEAAPFGSITINPIILNLFGGAGIPTTSGIENIYIMKHHLFDNTSDLKGHENIVEYNGTDAVITASGGSVNIPYNTYFDIVVAIRVDNDNCYDTSSEDNYCVEIDTSGQVSILDNSNNENEWTFVDGTPDYVRVNVVFDNVDGYKLMAGQTLTLDAIRLWVWG